MANFEDGTYGSAAGIALIAKVLAGRCTMQYTRVAVGKGTIPEGMTPKTMTEPADYVMDAMIAGVTNPVDGECTVSVQIKSDQVEHGFYCTGLLLYALDPDLGEIPYTYLFLENEPEWIRPASSIVGKLATFDVIAAVGDVDAVEAVIDPEAIATVARVAQMISEHNADLSAHPDLWGLIADLSAGAAVSRISVIIPADGWVEADEPFNSYGYICDVAVESVTADHWPMGSPDKASTDAACAAGFGGCEAMDGYLRFYAASKPEADVTATIVLIGEGAISGGTGSIPVASSSTLGGVKIQANSGLTIDSDGNLAVDTADDETASSAIEDVFDSKD